MSLSLLALAGLSGNSKAILCDQEPSLTCCPLVFLLPLPFPRFEDVLEENENIDDLGLSAPVFTAGLAAFPPKEPECRNEIPIRPPMPPSISLFQRTKPDFSLFRVGGLINTSSCLDSGPILRTISASVSFLQCSSPRSLWRRFRSLTTKTK